MAKHLRHAKLVNFQIRVNPQNKKKTHKPQHIILEKFRMFCAVCMLVDLHQPQVTQ